MSWYQPGGTSEQPAQEPPPPAAPAPSAEPAEPHQYRTSPPPDDVAGAKSGGLAPARRLRVPLLAVAILFVAVLAVLIYLLVT